jgi:hypothetical protein
MAGQIWFGNVNYAQWVPAPATGMERVRRGYTESIDFTNGGRWVENSYATNLEYSMDFPVQDSSNWEGIEAFQRYASGQYGTDYVRFVDPMAQNQNVFSETWSAPGMSELGAKRIYDEVPTSYVATTAANVTLYGWPPRYPQFTLTGAAGAVPTGQNSVFTLLIPTGYTLHMRATGSATGTGVVQVQPINIDRTLATPANLTMVASATAPSFPNTFSGATYRAVRVYLTRTTAVASTISLIAMNAQIIPTGTSPASTGRFIPGKGHSGLKFIGDAYPERYVMANRDLLGASIKLAEVEPWA